MVDILAMGKRARLAARELATVDRLYKDAFLLDLATALRNRNQEIVAANQQDIATGRKGGLSDALIDRLLLNEKRIEAMAADLIKLAAMPDPVGQIIDNRVLDNGILARRQRVPIGVMAVIYEARPNVTVDISALGLKAGNAVILRGGKETMLSNTALVQIIRDSILATGLPSDAVQFINDPDRKLVNTLVKMDESIDLLVPRGGNNLQKFCKNEATMPVMLGGIGICHLFVDESADLEKSLAVIQNAKVQRPSVCNALDTLLVHQAVSVEFLPQLVDYLKDDNVTLRLDSRSQVILGIDPARKLEPAGEHDFDQEWLSLVLGIRVVADLDEAIEHIWQHSTHHSDGILTRNKENGDRFVAQVDSAAVYVNASTRFTDGSQLGLGGEIAVSTQRLHARGPVGLEGLTSYKWVMVGDYTVRE